MSKSAHLTKVVDTHLYNSYLVLISNSKNSKWYPNLIVIISLSLKYAILFFKNCCYKLFCTGFTNTAGNTYYLYLVTKTLSIICCNSCKCLKGIFNLYAWSLWIFWHILAYYTKSAFFKNSIYKAMTVYSFTLCSNKDISLSYKSRVNVYSFCFFAIFLIIFRKIKLTAAGQGNIIKG